MRALRRFAPLVLIVDGLRSAVAEQRAFLEREIERWSALVARYGVTID